MIVNTRPEEIGKKTNTLLRDHGCNFIHIPLTEISKIEPTNEAKLLINDIDNYDALIFTSQSSVKYGISFLKHKYSNKKKIPIISIGSATQHLLEQLNISSDVPSTYDSLGLSKLIKENKYKRCLVFCGKEDPLILSMTEAEIHLFKCYESLAKKNVDLLKIKDYKKLIVLIYTNQSLEVFSKKYKKGDMPKIVLIAASKRIKELSVKYGFKNCFVAKSPLDKDMISTAMAKL
ncbi:MAG: hypothetical protein CMD68_05630 [Gammaproteobacteria bacterium]|nr:hypothetical protein [Gammaproteobacteria bacterium]